MLFRTVVTAWHRTPSLFGHPSFMRPNVVVLHLYNQCYSFLHLWGQAEYLTQVIFWNIMPDGGDRICLCLSSCILYPKFEIIKKTTTLVT